MRAKGKDDNIMAMLVKLNNVTIKRPTKFDIEKYNLTKGNRVATGLMNIELIAKKRKFLFSYTVLSGPDLEAILAIIDSNTIFFTLSYTENDTTVKTATVYAGAIKSSRFRTDGVWYWKDVSFDLIER